MAHLVPAAFGDYCIRGPAPASAFRVRQSFFLAVEAIAAQGAFRKHDELALQTGRLSEA